MVFMPSEAPQQFTATRRNEGGRASSCAGLQLGIATIGLVCCALAQPAKAAGPGSFYISGAVTGSDLDRPSQTIANAPTPGSTLQVVNGVDFGWGGQVAVGYAYKYLRIEAEVGHTANHSAYYSALRPISITLPQSGDNTVTRYMANGYFDLPVNQWPFKPYLGAGVGAASAHVTTFAAPARAPKAPPSQILDFNDTRFAYQLTGGVSLPVTAHLALTAQYRWFDGGTFNGVDARGERATRTLHGSNFDLGARFSF